MHICKRNNLEVNTALSVMIMMWSMIMVIMVIMVMMVMMRCST